jgi:para-aminobenzoate synthetase component 1
VRIRELPLWTLARGSSELGAALASGWRGRDVAWLDGDGSGALGRWSFVACDPSEVREALWRDPEPFAVLRGLGPSSSSRDERDDGSIEGAPDPAIVPRWIGMVAYDAAWSAGRGVGLRRGPVLQRSRMLPVARFARYDAVVAIDRVEGRAWIIADDDLALARAEARVAQARDRPGPSARAGEVSAEGAGVHRAAIERALEAIAAGDIYQVNLARRWSAPLEGDPIALFLAMREASPVPLGAYIEGTGWAALARTMERFLRFDARDRSIETRPIKGTIARAGDDRAEAAALRTDAKERAEHAMIVDLMRNDLGRVAEIGSVEVEDVMRVEPYAGLSHLVSDVRARVRAECDLEAILHATFPPGSITGAPKLRAMEIIESLERQARGIYCGAIGHVDRAGGLSLAVAIRTATVENGVVTYAAGGGLVEASDPEREVAETELKARVFLDAAGSLARRHDREGRAKKRMISSGVV